ncbi:TetR/AcrR family transcriptional regulator [Pantoea agglomerans]|uniref:TetR/AcrR family transcriptional regulator n=1 Tax=Enterobacter agglomerans TaxID=549 RepID=UPI001878813F|nr:TetR/AcrR family transcriptional regulator [Pantoea agglomerans]MBE5681848.1 TetR/AcrR family transcriptional regulator [Pantoea agglomerans]
MARPLSEEKRQAIMVAATELVAKLGTGASTAKIAQAAGLGEGTLFTYFPTKDDLLNELLIKIETDLAQAMLEACIGSGDRRERLLRIWNSLVDWGMANPSQRMAMRQLRVSDRITEANQRICKDIYSEARQIVDESLAGYAAPGRASFYTDTVLMGLAEIVIEAITQNPKNQEHFKQAGFDLFWKGVAA